MSIEPTCDYCGVSVKPRCQDDITALSCRGYQASQQSDAVEIAEYRRQTAQAFPLPLPKAASDLHKEYLDGLDKRAEELAALMPGDSKPTNPKDMIAVTKAPMHLVPSTIKALAAMSFAEGASKYGAYNWRVAGVRASVYKSALERHLEKWWNGEEVDPKTGVPHLASVIACAGIIADADLVGKLTDDRPPKAPIGGLFDATEGVVEHLYRINGDKNPYHYTIKDSA